MIRVKVNSLWRGRVGIRDKYIKQASQNQENILIICQGEQMLVPYLEIKKKIVGKSNQAFPDRFSNTSHFLIYFQWQPTQIQSKLL